MTVEVAQSKEQINDQLMKGVRDNQAALEAYKQTIENTYRSADYKHAANERAEKKLLDKVEKQLGLLDKELGHRQKLKEAYAAADDKAAKEAQKALKNLRTANPKAYGAGDTAQIVTACPAKNFKKVYLP